MAYKNLVGIPCVNRKEVFQRCRDFLCKRNGTYDYSVTGIGWTLYDSFYASSEDVINTNDWFVIYSPGEGGKEDLYFRFTYTTTYIVVTGFLSWNAATNTGVQQFTTLLTQFYVSDTAPTLWIYGDLDSVIMLNKLTVTATYEYACIFGKYDTLYDNTIAISALPTPMGVDVVIDVGTVPVGADWSVGRKLFIRDNNSVNIVTIKAVTASTVTVDTVTNYDAGAKLAADICYAVNSTNNISTGVCYGLITHAGLLSSSIGSPDFVNVITTSAQPDPLNGEHVFKPIICSIAASGYGGALRNIYGRGAGGLANLDVVYNAGYNFRAFIVYNSVYIVVKEV